MSKVTLVYNRVCPFAQRVWLALLQKEVPFEKKEFSLTEKPTEFTETYRKAYAHDPKSDGKVPILIHGDRVLTQSDLLSWYVAEQFNTGLSLIPKDSFSRLKLRWFAQEVVSKVVGVFYSPKQYNNLEHAEKDKIKARITEALSKLESSIAGPYVLGEEFTLADILVYPWLQRWVVLEKLFGLAITNEYPKVLALRDTVFNRPSVQKTREETSDDYYLQIYSPYFGVPI